jgi:hypothetical protein
MIRALLIPAAVVTLIILGGCGQSGPTESDMAGCAIRGGGTPISIREVADCAADRAEIEQQRARGPP